MNAYVVAAVTAGMESSLLFELLVVLATAVLVAILMQRARLAVIPAYLIAGALTGPNALAFVRSPDSLNTISQMGIILLLFGIGLQLELHLLRQGLRTLLTAGVGSCVLSILVGWPLAMFFGLPAPTALAVCMALSLSSTAVVLRILSERRELRRPEGRLAFSILVVQDLLVVAMLVVLPLLSTWAGVDQAATGDATAAPTWGGFLLSAAGRVAGVAALILLANLALPHLLHEAARGPSREVMMILSVATALGAAVATQALGFSLEMGAFLAGLTLSATPFGHHLSGQIGPLRDLFMAIFFVSVGMHLDPACFSGWWIILLGGLLMGLVKAGVIGLVSWSLGASGGVAVVVGLSLSQGGEFSLLLLEKARAAGLVGEMAAAQVIAIVVASLIVTPGLVELSHRLAGKLSWIKPAPWLKSMLLREATDGRSPAVRHAIIAGYGPVGQSIAEKLDQAAVAYTIIELNPATVRAQTRLGKSIVYGDAAQAAVLESAGVHHADALILTVPDEKAVFRACRIARHMNPDIFIAARTTFYKKGMRAADVGADRVIVEEQATAEAMQRVVVERLGPLASPLAPPAEDSR